MPEILLPAAVTALLGRLRDGGFSAYAVGGCIRDSLLGRPVHDWDITTAARPEDTKAVFSDLRTLDTGLRHGTVTVLCENEPYEITTYRIDGAYADGRHPDAVAFTDLLAEDLKRRDFTVNAMAYAPSDGLVDLFGGSEDLQRRLMRAVGDPAERFTEDALRILRAVRFAAVLGFSVEEETFSAACALRDRLSMVSGERICQEMNKLLCADSPARILRKGAPVIAAAWPLASDNVRLAADCISSLPPRLPLRLAALFDGTEPSKLCAQLMRLRQSRRVAAEAAAIADTAAALKDAAEGRMRFLLGGTSLSVCRDACLLAAAKGTLSPEEAAARAAQFETWAAQHLCCRREDLALSGRDLMTLGVPAGTAVGKWLDLLLAEVLEGRLPNTQEALAEYVRRALR